MACRLVPHRLALWAWISFVPTIGIAAPPATNDTVITIYPVTTGLAHPPATKISRVMVVGTQHNPSAARAVAMARDMFQRGGLTVVDATAPSGAMQFHGPPSPDRRDADAALRSAAKASGADHLVVIEVTDRLVVEKGRGTVDHYLHDERVTVRGVDVNSGAIVLEGEARWSQPVERPGEHVRELTAYAVARAVCLPEKWEEASSRNQGRGKCHR